MSSKRISGNGGDEVGRYTLEGEGHRRYMARRAATVQAQFLLEYLKPGARVLDAGCGAGAITLGIADSVAPGEVLGLDREVKQVDAGAAAARERGLENLTFLAGDVYGLPFASESFDVIFSNAVLEHLSDPARTLREFHRVLKRGGVVGIRNTDCRGNLLFPEDALLRESFELAAKLRTHHGGDYYLGSKTMGLLVDAGFIPVSVAATYETDSTPEAKRHWAKMIAAMSGEGPFATGLLELRLTDRDGLKRIADAWFAWAENPTAFQARAWVHGIGRKA